MEMHQHHLALLAAIAEAKHCEAALQDVADKFLPTVREAAMKWQRFNRVSREDMLKIETEKLLSAEAYIAGKISMWKIIDPLLVRGSVAPVEMTLADKAQFIRAIETLRDGATAFGLEDVAMTAQRTFDFYLDRLADPQPFVGQVLGEVMAPADRLLHAFNAAISRRAFFVVDVRHERFLESATPCFGQQVADAFPSAAFDIEEAGNCRALGRWTASVMHAMRALEVGLEALAAHMGVENQANWNATLNLIEAKLRAVTRKEQGADAEQWAAEAGTHLRFIKNAWRNHAMHARTTYDEARAIRIFDETASFMQHLAQQLSQSESDQRV